jgi:hypothetical protein
MPVKKTRSIDAKSNWRILEYICVFLCVIDAGDTIASREACQIKKPRWARLCGVLLDQRWSSPSP